MDKLLKDNKFLLILILIIALLLRLWDLYSPLKIWSDEFTMYSSSMLQFNFDFFDAIKNNTQAPLHYFYLKLWMNIFKNSDLMIKLSSLIPNLLGCFVLYHVGKSYPSKDNSVNIGLTCSAISAISAFLIFFAQEVRIYSLIFLLSSLILLFSIKMYENPSKKNATWLFVLSLLLILEHTIGLVYVIFNTFGLLAFKQKQKKAKNGDDIYVSIIAGLILCLPLIPFIFRIFLHPNYFSQWWAPFNWSNVWFYLTDLFSPVLKNITTTPVNFYNQIINNDNINFGFIFFAIIPSLIALYCIVKSNIEAKRINKYFLAVFSAVFLTVLIVAIASKIVFLTKYLVELYPILILMASIGFNGLNSKNQKITLATIYVFLSLFFMLVSNLTNVALLG